MGRKAAARRRIKSQTAEQRRWDQQTERIANGNPRSWANIERAYRKNQTRLNGRGT